MAFALFPIGAVGLSTVEGVSAYWVRLPTGSKPVSYTHLTLPTISSV